MDPELDFENAIEIDQPDGGVIIQFPQEQIKREISSFEKNIAEELSEAELSELACEILDGVEQDENSRAEWLANRAKGMDLLGLKLESPGMGSAPVEGQSTVRHPLLLEASLRFQANARGELLPASGPIKVKNVGSDVTMGDALAERLERDLNSYLTDVATEYYPDTDRMLFGVGWSGCGFKKGYHCPLRNRPVIESIDAKDLIVNNTATDLNNAVRITHRIKMHKNVVRRMQIAGAYLETDLSVPSVESNIIDQKIKALQGISTSQLKTDDIEHTIYECYCDLDIPGYEHKVRGKKTGLPLPYKVSIDRDSRRILEIRRNWREGDETYTKRKTFVMYPFVPMFGFYPSGLLHILGNTTSAITAAWRILLDAGMFGNFPGFLYLKKGGRQDDNRFRIAPGSGAAIDADGADIRQCIMPLPYKTPDAATMALVDGIAQTGQRLGGTAEIQVGEGRQDAPVGTTIALLEQAAKIMDAVHKRIHAAQAEEFQILRELLEEDPDALWRHRRNGRPQDAGMLIIALSDYDLVPVADPNTPSHVYRIAKCQILKQMSTGNQLYDQKAVDTYILQQMKIADPERFFAPPPPPQAQQDPALMIAQSKVQSDMIGAQARAEANKIKFMDLQQRAAEKEADRQQRSVEKAIDRQNKMELERIKLAERLAVHPTSAPLVTG